MHSIQIGISTAQHKAPRGSTQTKTKLPLRYVLEGAKLQAEGSPIASVTPAAATTGVHAAQTKHAAAGHPTSPVVPRWRKALLHPERGGGGGCKPLRTEPSPTALPPEGVLAGTPGGHPNNVRCAGMRKQQSAQAMHNPFKCSPRQCMPSSAQRNAHADIHKVRPVNAERSTPFSKGATAGCSGIVQHTVKACSLLLKGDLCTPTKSRCG